MKTERLAKLTNLRSCVRRNVNEAYVYRRYIQSGVNCVIFLVLVFTTVRFHSAMIGNVSFSLWAAQGHLLRPHVASIQINDRNVYSLVIYTSSLHCDIFFFFFLSKSKKQDQHKYVIASYTKFRMLFFTRMDFGLLKNWLVKEAIPEKYPGSVDRWTFVVHLKHWFEFLRLWLRLIIYQNVRLLTYTWIQTSLDFFRLIIKTEGLYIGLY